MHLIVAKASMKISLVASIFVLITTAMDSESATEGGIPTDAPNAGNPNIGEDPTMGNSTGDDTDMGAEGMKVVQGWDTSISLALLAFTVVVTVLLYFFVWRPRENEESKSGWSSVSFEPPSARKLYFDAKNAKEGLDELKKKLMRRALASIPIILDLQKDGQEIDRLYKKGMITDDVHSQTLAIKEFIDSEIPEVQEEADEYLDGWGEHIWAQAMQWHQMIQKMKDEKNAAHSNAEGSGTKTVKSKAKGKKGMAVKDNENAEEKADRMAKELLEEEEEQQKK